MATAHSFRAAYRSGRCVQPVNGYYEWQSTDGSKRPFYIHPSDNAPNLFFAALWTEVALSDYQGFTCATLTEPAVKEISELHDRQPVMLDRQGMELWLDGVPIEVIPRLPITKIRWHEVSRAVGSVRNNSEDLPKPVGLDGADGRH